LLFAAACVDDEKNHSMSYKPAAESSVEVDQNDQKDARKNHGQSGRNPSMQRKGRKIVVKIRNHQTDSRKKQAEKEKPEW
jgi:hypothetical protein